VRSRQYREALEELEEKEESEDEGEPADDVVTRSRDALVTSDGYFPGLPHSVTLFGFHTT